MTIMRTLLAISLALIAEACYGHGNPIHVNVTDGRLVVAGGLPALSGFANMAFDDDEDAYLDIAPGFQLGSTLPGFDVSGMEAGSQLNLEVIPRPDFTAPSTPQRWLWFWDKATHQVDIAPNDPTVELASQRLFGSVLLTQLEAPTTGAFMQVMEPLSTDLGTHQHPILYLLDDSPAAKFGAYGFFARLTSPNYEPSEPFLIALNYSLAPAEYRLAAKQINAAARLPGDYDGDDDVDGNDFLVWQRTLGSSVELSADGSLNDLVDADDLDIWKLHFGDVHSPPAEVAQVPEPNSLPLGILTGLGVYVAALQRRRSVNQST